ncbi:CGNR zinc finger domain-containing protein [Streptomyces sp. NPDC051132]|uniref:CGNR zinc finger domain-containing protein n=1 Tax=unclassified Streptomyces TaxID=2593676 RepID=UPI00343D5FEE
MAPESAPPAHAPRFDAGRVCLDLLATLHPDERLDGVSALRAWIADAGLVPDGTPLGHADGSWPAAFQDLRESVGHVVRGLLAAPSPAYGPALGRVNEAARCPTPAPVAVPGPDGRPVRELAGPPGCAALLAVVARDAVDLLTDPVARAAVRRCAADDCPLVYLDASRGRRRRWCSSEGCGNRERVARHRRRAALARS